MIKRPNEIKSYFLILLGLLYIILGLYIFTTRKNLTESPWGELLSLLFILYGAWRIYRAFRSPPQEISQ